MSRFKTSIPVDVAAVIKLLPARSYVEAVTLSADRASVELVWGCDDLVTPYTFPVECSVADLQARRATADKAREERLAQLTQGAGNSEASESANPPKSQIGNDKVSVDTRRRGGRKAV